MKTTYLKHLSHFNTGKHLLSSGNIHFCHVLYEQPAFTCDSCYSIIAIVVFVCFVKTLDFHSALKTVCGEISGGIIVSREKPYTKRPLSMLQCYSNNPYPSQNHPKALISFLRLHNYEKFSCIARCLFRNQAIFTRMES